MNEIDKIRKEIDEIDEKILALLNKRGELAKIIGDLKIKQNLDIYQPSRENEVINRLKSKKNILNPNGIESIWKEIISACKVVQGSINKVGYLGPMGTFTHQAALEFFPKAGTEFYDYKSIAEIFENIEKDIIEFGVMPIENSREGTIRETLDMLIEKNLIIYGEVELRVVQNLISLKNSNISKIKTIYSHPQAFAQTRSWIKSNISGANLINTNSTAEAAQKVKDLNDESNAAIGPEFASKVFDLKVLCSNIEDNPSNYTRFLIISKKENKQKEEKRIKTSVVFVTRHVPGALYSVLKIFAEAKINLLKIESRPRREGETRWEYIFLMDFEGDKDDSKIKKVVDDMNQNTIWSKILGSYPFM